MTVESIARILTGNLDIWTGATERGSSGGRGRSKGLNLCGIERLRALILELAVRGKLVPQNAGDRPASELLKRVGAKGRTPVLSEPSLLGDSDGSQVDWPFSLPRSWSWSRLGVVTNYGETEKVNPGEVGSETWVLELEDIEKGSSRLIQRVSYSDRPFRSQKNRFQCNDVIYGKLRPYLDKVIIADEPGVCTTEMVPLRGIVGLVPAYLRIFLKSPYFVELATNSTHGMNLPRLGTEKARQAPFALPPEPEQHRIVAKVDELMALCDQLEAETYEAIEAHDLLVESLLATLNGSRDATELAENWERIETHFDLLFTTDASIGHLKQTILQLGVTGRLVPQDANDEPASELLTRINKEVVTYSKAQGIRPARPDPIDEQMLSFPPPAGWLWARLSTLFNVITDGDHQPPPKADEGVAFLTIGNITTGKLDFAGCRLVPESYYRSLAPYRTPAKGDILYTVVGATYGRPAIVEADREFCVQRHIAILKPVENMDRRFVAWLLTSPLVYEQASKSTTGTAQPTIALRPLRNFIVPLPPLVEQQRIAKKLDQLMGICDELREQLTQAQQAQIQFADAVASKSVA